MSHLAGQKYPSTPSCVFHRGGIRRIPLPDTLDDSDQHVLDDRLSAYPYLDVCIALCHNASGRS